MCKLYCKQPMLLIMVLATVDAQHVEYRFQCNSDEVLLRSYVPRLDRFCKPWLALATELYKHRWCLCKEGYVRNAWGDCISHRECNSCASERHSDFNGCSSACPLVCGKPEPQICTRQCVVGCACAPGYVLDPWGKRPCVTVAGCPPKCPRYSSFQLCKSNCAPTCNGPRQDICAMTCNNGECVCWPGFYKVFRKGEKHCVPPNQCPRTQ
ncbi:tenascin-X-like isoform X2 [Dermacentor albipictus]|uniref:tenascin-X-like isoform X2 n=1 Tax=Dermacentor albipictus TaxID=60249 RepID=UPI0038FCB8C5